MKYDFDSVISRMDTGSLKWDVSENELPMWVADMDFKTAPEIIGALVKRAEHGIFGYNVVTEDWYSAIQNWWENRHGFAIKKEWLAFCTGVVPAITSAVRSLTKEDDNIVVQTPVYDIFFHSVENHGRRVVENRLEYSGGQYSIDFTDLEAKLALPRTSMMILCNPHNPAGKIWSKGDLQKIGALCKKHGVTVLSDEIHCDLTEPGCRYTPFASVSEECAGISVTCVSASKAFNLAGLQSAAVIIPDKDIRQKAVRGLNSDEVAEPNSFAAVAAVAAFTKGGEWLDQLNAYLSENRKTAARFIESELPYLRLTSQTATYLLWIDCAAVTQNAEELCRFIREKTGLFLSAGNQYRGNGNTFVRMNIACPRRQVEKGLLLLKQGIEEYRS